MIGPRHRRSAICALDPVKPETAKISAHRRRRRSPEPGLGPFADPSLAEALWKGGACPGCDRQAPRQNLSHRDPPDKATRETITPSTFPAPVWVICRPPASSSPTSALERRADLERAAPEIHDRHVQLSGREARPRAVCCPMVRSNWPRLLKKSVADTKQRQFPGSTNENSISMKSKAADRQTPISGELAIHRSTNGCFGSFFNSLSLGPDIGAIHTSQTLQFGTKSRRRWHRSPSSSGSISEQGKPSEQHVPISC